MNIRVSIYIAEKKARLFLSNQILIKSLPNPTPLRGTENLEYLTGKFMPEDIANGMRQNYHSYPNVF